MLFHILIHKYLLWFFVCKLSVTSIVRIYLQYYNTNLWSHEIGKIHTWYIKKWRVSDCQVHLKFNQCRLKLVWLLSGLISPDFSSFLSMLRSNRYLKYLLRVSSFGTLKCWNRLVLTTKRIEIVLSHHVTLCDTEAPTGCLAYSTIFDYIRSD